MGLAEEHKAERRGRILAASRKLIAERGYAGLTMRDLADAARVSVPTLYNLFGSKDAIVAAEMEATGALISGALATVRGGDFLDRASALCAAGVRVMMAVPGYYREMARVFTNSSEMGGVRRAIEDQYIAVMADNLRSGQAAGHLAAWVDADALAQHLFAHFMSAFLGWCCNDLDDDAFPRHVDYGLSLLLLGVTQGPPARRLEQRIRELQPELRERT